MATIFSGGSVSPFLFHSNKSMSFTPKIPSLQLKRPISAKSVASVGTDTSLSPAVQTFWKWLQEEGVITAKTPVKASVVPEGLGLVAIKDISRNDVVLQVPKRLWINPDAVEASEIGRVCSELKPWLSVILFLIRERSRSDSIWKHYFGILPQETDSTIYWWVSFLWFISNISLM
jgi:[ribulose-bisphosphate carboxylase]-lysine N-methyltransferase